STTARAIAIPILHPIVFARRQVNPTRIKHTTGSERSTIAEGSGSIQPGLSNVNRPAVAASPITNAKIQPKNQRGPSHGGITQYWDGRFVGLDSGASAMS